MFTKFVFLKFNYTTAKKSLFAKKMSHVLFISEKYSGLENFIPIPNLIFRFSISEILTD